MKRVNFVFLFIIVLFFLKSNAQNSEVSPLNPEFDKFIKNFDASKDYGIIPHPLILPVAYISHHNSKFSLPAKYDLRDYGMVTAVRNQGNCNSSWTFGVMASVESSWLKYGFGGYNLSEDNLKNCHNFDVPWCVGGNIFMSSAYISEGKGPIPEKYDKYSPTSTDCNKNLMLAGYVSNIIYIPKTDVDGIKKAIISNGALYSVMYWSDAYFRSADNTYFYGGSTSANHGIAVIGWDDNKVTAGGTGAWIIKNSYGSGWGENGFLYIAYQDTQVLYEIASFDNKSDYKPYSKVYSYSEFGMLAWVTGSADAGNVAYGMIKYTTTDSQYVSRVGTFVNDNNTKLNFYLYSNFDGTNFSGLLDSVKDKSVIYPGYYSYNWSKPVKMSKGTNFYIKVKYETTLGTIAHIPTEQVVNGFASKATIETGKCWRGSDNIHWSAMGSNTNYKLDLCIKAYSYPQLEVFVPTASFIASDTVICQNQKVSFTNNTIKAKKYQWYFDNVKYDTTKNITVKFNKAGLFNIKLFAYNDTLFDSISKNILVHPVPVVGTSEEIRNICEGASLTIYSTVNSGTSPFKYNWSTGANSTYISIKPPTPDSILFYPITSNVVYRLTVTDVNSCVGNDSIIVYIHPLPRNIIKPTDSTKHCDGSQVELYVEPQQGFQNIWYWLMNKQNIQGATAKKYIAATSADYAVFSTISYISNSPANTFELSCSDTSNTLKVIINPYAGVDNIPSLDSICSGQSIKLYAKNISELSRQWYKNDVPIPDATDTVYVANSTASYTVKYNYKNLCNNSSADKKVYVRSLPTALITPAGYTTFCEGGSVNLNAAYAKGYLFQWKMNNSNIIDATTSIYTANLTGSYSYTVTSLFNCSNTSTVVNITVNPLPAADITPMGNTNFCEGFSVILNANLGADLKYQWKKNDVNIDGATEANYFADSSGLYTFVVTNSNNCVKASSSVTVTVNSFPVAYITPEGTVTICEGGSQLLTANSDNGYSYQWKKNDVNINGATKSSYDAVLDGIYTCYITNLNNCSKISNSTTIVVNKSTSLKGFIYFDSQPAIKGILKLYQLDENNKMFYISTTDINPDGSYRFDNLLIGKYYTYVNLDKQQYPLAIDTYYGDVYLWSNAKNIDINDCRVFSIENLNINVIKQNEHAANVQISGIVNYDSIVNVKSIKHFKKPAKNITLFLQDRISKIAQYQTTTNDTGYYAFEGIDYGDYNILVDKPGYVMDSVLNVMANNVLNIFKDKDYLIVSDTIKVESFYIDGKLVYDNPPDSLAIPNTKIKLMSEGIVIDVAYTDLQGKFRFNKVKNASYQIIPDITFPGSGYDPGDALFVNRTYIGATNFTDELRARAADVDTNSSIDPGDALAINRRYIGSISTFKAGEWLYDNILLVFRSSNVKVIIKTICVGDVNGSFTFKKKSFK